jgi:hypothetical protein
MKQKFALTSTTFDPIKYPRGQSRGDKPADDKHLEQLYGYMVNNGKWLQGLAAGLTQGRTQTIACSLWSACAEVRYGVLCSDEEFWFARLGDEGEGDAPRLMMTQKPMKVRGHPMSKA